MQIFWERQIWLFSPPWIHWKRFPGRKVEESLWREVRRLLEEFLEETDPAEKRRPFSGGKVQNLEEKLNPLQKMEILSNDRRALGFSGYGYRRNGSDTQAYRR